MGKIRGFLGYYGISIFCGAVGAFVVWLALAITGRFVG